MGTILSNRYFWGDSPLGITKKGHLRRQPFSTFKNKVIFYFNLICGKNIFVKPAAKVGENRHSDARFSARFESNLVNVQKSGLFLAELTEICYLCCINRIYVATLKQNISPYEKTVSQRDEQKKRAYRFLPSQKSSTFADGMQDALLVTKQIFYYSSLIKQLSS